MNPLIGHNDDSLGPRFPPLSNGGWKQTNCWSKPEYRLPAYDLDLQRAAFRASHELGLPDHMLQSGTYAWVLGPTYETRADCKFLRDYGGADIVGMSTVPEVITARWLVSVHTETRTSELTVIYTLRT